MRVNENFWVSRKNFSLFKNFHIACHKEDIGFQWENILLCRKAMSCLAGDNVLLIKVNLKAMWKSEFYRYLIIQLPAV